MAEVTGSIPVLPTTIPLLPHRTFLLFMHRYNNSMPFPITLPVYRKRLAAFFIRSVTMTPKGQRFSQAPHAMQFEAFAASPW